MRALFNRSKVFIAIAYWLLAIDPALADSTINGLGAGSAVVGTDIFPAYQGANPAKGVTAVQIKSYVAQTFNVTNFGAACDGVTNDTVAINSAFNAALNSAAYTSNKAVKITGPLDGNHQGCNVTQVNATGFTLAPDGAQLLISDLMLNCSGAGNICLDTIGSLNVNTENLTLVGSASSPPSIGMQEGTTNPAAGCCIHHHYNRQVVGTYTFAAVYNGSSESTTDFAPIIRNDGPSVGPIRLPLGAITGGSAYTNGTYTNVPLTGGTGAGALATIVVAANAVSSVTLTYQGKGYAPSDSLSASAANIGGTGSGFSVMVNAISPFSLVLDGENHWRVSSAFQTITFTPDTYHTFTQNNIFGGSVRYYGGSTSGAPLWIGAASGHQFRRVYFANAAPTECVQLFDNGAKSDGNSSLVFDMRCETNMVQNTFWMYGSQAAPALTSFNFKDDFDEAQVNIFGVDTNITSVKATDINIDLTGAFTPSLFQSAKLWTVSGSIYVPQTAIWNAPAAFSGRLCISTFCTPPSAGPVDLVPSAALALSCARLLNHAYTGPLCNIHRASDSTNIDMYPDGFGNLDVTAFQSFCNGTTCTVATEYDQSGNTNNAVNATVANQPPIAADASLGGRYVGQWTDASAVVLSVTSAASIDQLFATSGYLSVAARAIGNPPTAADRLIYKQNWDVRYNAGSTTTMSFNQGAATTSGAWITPANGIGGRIYDVQYSSALNTNIPTFGSNGTNQSLTSTQPVGVISSDAGINLLIGNSASTGGNRGFSGNIGEVVMWKLAPTASQLEAVRRNQGAYYGLGATVN